MATLFATGPCPEYLDMLDPTTRLVSLFDDDKAGLAAIRRWRVVYPNLVVGRLPFGDASNMLQHHRSFRRQRSRRWPRRPWNATDQGAAHDASGAGAVL